MFGGESCCYSGSYGCCCRCGGVCWFGEGENSFACQAGVDLGFVRGRSWEGVRCRRVCRGRLRRGSLFFRLCLVHGRRRREGLILLPSIFLSQSLEFLVSASTFKCALKTKIYSDDVAFFATWLVLQIRSTIVNNLRKHLASIKIYN